MASKKYLNTFDARYATVVPAQIAGPPFTGDPSDPEPKIDYQSVELFGLKLEGRIPHYPAWLLATCTASELDGHHVYCTGRDAVNNVPSVAKCDPSNTAKMPAIGQIYYKFSDTICLIQIVAGAEMLSAALLTPGAVYFVGTDALPAKVGDANIPGAGLVKQAIGVAVSTKRLLKVPGLLTTTF